MNWDQYMDSAELYQVIDTLDKKVEIITARYKSVLEYLQNLKCGYCNGTGKVMVCRDCGHTSTGELASCRCDENYKGVGGRVIMKPSVAGVMVLVKTQEERLGLIKWA